MSITSPATHAAEPINSQRRATTMGLSALARRMSALIFLLTVTLGFVGTSGAAARSNPHECNNLFGSGHGYYGCGDINHAWHHGTYGWILYYW